MFQDLIYSCLSETAKSLLWLLATDPKGWVGDEYAVKHPATGVGIWIANQTFGLSAYVECGHERSAHVLRGRRVKLRWLDRKVLYHSFKKHPPVSYIPDIIDKWRSTHAK